MKRFLHALLVCAMCLLSVAPADAGFLFFGGRRQAQRNAFNQGFQQGVNAQARA